MYAMCITPTYVALMVQGIENNNDRECGLPKFGIFFSDILIIGRSLKGLSKYW